MFCGKEIKNRIKKIEKKDSSVLSKFNGIGTRLNDDNCFLSYKFSQSIGPGSYILQNFKNDESNQNATEFALNQNTVNIKNGFGVSGIDGCNIEIDNELRIKSGNVITNDKNINQLFSRPFLTVPYMGRGTGNPCFDTMIKPGEDTYQAKACNVKNQDTNFIPLVKCLKKNIQNPKHLITEDVDNNWIRGGLPSRQLVRDIEYKSCLEN